MISLEAFLSAYIVYSVGNQREGPRHEADFGIALAGSYDAGGLYTPTNSAKKNDTDMAMVKTSRCFFVKLKPFISAGV